MRSTMQEAKEILEARGLTISSNRPNDQNLAIYWKGEWVGYISEFSVSLHHDLPSLGLTEQGELIPLTADNASSRLAIRIDSLLDSPRRYEERQRHDNNRNFAIQYMRSHGFEVKEDGKSEYPDKYLYYLRGELVGWSYDTVMYLQPDMPSLLQMGILPQRGKTEIPFNRPGIEVHDRLRDAVNELLSSSDSYEDIVKRHRAKKVRDYFKYHRSTTNS